MKIIRMEKIGTRKIFYVEERNTAGEIIESCRYDCKTFKVHYGNRTDIFIGDENDRIRPLPHHYVNEIRKEATVETRIMTGEALNYYYTFCSMKGYNPLRFSKVGYEGFKRFLLGFDVIAEDGSDAEGLDPRTVGGIISVVRKFLIFYEYPVKAFLVGRDVDGRRHLDANGGWVNGLGDTDLRGNPRKSFEAVEHFIPQQAAAIAASMARHNDQRMLTLFKLGYQTGFRRGELLGITIKDIVCNHETYVDRETGETITRRICRIIIRNRPGEDSQHRSKTLGRPRRTNSKKKSNSYYDPEINEETYDMLMRYYHQSRDVDVLGAATVNKIKKATEVPGETGNYYLFYNIHRGVCRLLSGQTFNNRLKKYYTEQGLSLRNVSHAIRHSFAMFLVYYSKYPVDIKIVQRALRHASPLSTLIYLNIPKGDVHALVNMHGSEISAIFKNYQNAA